MADGLTMSLVSCLNVLEPSSERMTLWIGALRSGDYKFGYGLLRTADDEYDPFGVLAALSYVEWEWNDNEGAWALDGEALFLTSAQLGEWLEMKHTALDTRDTSVVDQWCDRFAQTVAQIADGDSNFYRVAEHLEAALRTSAQQREHFAGLRRTSRGGEHYIGPDQHERLFGGRYPAFHSYDGGR